MGVYVWCALFVHRNINHSVCLVCISERFSLLPPPPKKTTAEAQLREYIAGKQDIPNAVTVSLMQKQGQAGQCGSYSMCWRSGAGRKEIALISVSCFLQIATSKSRCGPQIYWPCVPMFQFLGGLFITILAAVLHPATILLHYICVLVCLCVPLTFSVENIISSFMYLVVFCTDIGKIFHKAMSYRHIFSANLLAQMSEHWKYQCSKTSHM